MTSPSPIGCSELLGSSEVVVSGNCRLRPKLPAKEDIGAVPWHQDREWCHSVPPLLLLLRVSPRGAAVAHALTDAAARRCGTDHRVLLPPLQLQSLLRTLLQL